MKWRLLFLSAPLLLVGAMVVASSPASGVGNAALNARIITTPVPAWSVSTSASEELATAFQKEMKSTYSGTVVTAVKDWSSATSSGKSQFASISLAAYLDASKAVHTGLLRSLRGYALVACNGVTGHPAQSMTAVPSIPGALLVTCETPQGFAPVDVAFFAKANVYAVVVLASPTPNQVVAIAQKQYSSLPRTNFGTN